MIVVVASAASAFTEVVVIPMDCPFAFASARADAITPSVSIATERTWPVE